MTSDVLRSAAAACKYWATTGAVTDAVWCWCRCIMLQSRTRHDRAIRLYCLCSKLSPRLNGLQDVAPWPYCLQESIEPCRHHQLIQLLQWQLPRRCLCGSRFWPPTSSLQQERKHTWRKTDTSKLKGSESTSTPATACHTALLL
jgi:hypothetical protein